MIQMMYPNWSLFQQRLHSFSHLLFSLEKLSIVDIHSKRSVIFFLYLLSGWCQGVSLTFLCPSKYFQAALGKVCIILITEPKNASKFNIATNMQFVLRLSTISKYLHFAVY